MIPKVSETINMAFYLWMLDEMQEAGLFYTNYMEVPGFGMFCGIWEDPIDMLTMGTEL